MANTLTFRLDAGLRERLEARAAEEHRSLSYVVNRALEEALDGRVETAPPWGEFEPDPQERSPILDVDRGSPEVRVQDDSPGPGWVKVPFHERGDDHAVAWRRG